MCRDQSWRTPVRVLPDLVFSSHRDSPPDLECRPSHVRTPDARVTEEVSEIPCRESLTGREAGEGPLPVGQETLGYWATDSGGTTGSTGLRTPEGRWEGMRSDFGLVRSRTSDRTDPL